LKACSPRPERPAARLVAAQGSDNLDHWRVNLTFDPVPFEGLGIKVHRGVYEAAALLYDRFLPLVQDHLTSSPFAKVGEQGQASEGLLGGSSQSGCVANKA
jgi:hypothetical protein